MAGKSFEPKQTAKPLADLLLDFFSAGKGSSGEIKAETEIKDIDTETDILDLEVPAGALWKLLGVTVSGSSPVWFEVVHHAGGADHVVLRGDAKKYTATPVPLYSYVAREGEKVIVRVDRHLGGTVKVKASLIYEELT